MKTRHGEPERHRRLARHAPRPALAASVLLLASAVPLLGAEWKDRWPLSEYPGITPAGEPSSTAGELGSAATAGHSIRGVPLSDGNGNGTPDALDIAGGTSGDCNANGVPDECDLEPDGVGPLEHRVFVSSVTHNGNFGGLAGADAMCQQLAENAGLLRQYKAIMSDSSSSAASRLVLNGGGIYKLDSAQTKISVDADGNLWNGIDSVMDRDEAGGLVPGTVWTGTQNDGSSATNSCQDWSTGIVVSSANVGVIGNTAGWVNNGTATCNNLPRIYCISQGVPTERDCNANGIPDSCDVASETSNDCNANGVPDECDLEPDGVGPLEHRVFVSSQSHNGNFGGLAGADAMCQQLAENAGLRRQYKAIMSDSTSSAASRLVLNGGGIYKLDSAQTKVSVDADGNLWNGIDTVINLNQAGGLVTIGVWTGTQTDGTSSNNTCQGWTSASGGPTGRFGSTQSAPQWVDSGGTGCSALRRLYCISQGIPAESDCNNNGIPDDCDPPCNLGMVAPTAVRLVRSCAPPGGNGLSWSTAFGTLQDALAAAAGSGGTITQLWVAGGIYHADVGGGQTPGNRSATFLLRNNLAIYGGFACGDDELSDRNPAANVTVLSGDLYGNDGPNFANNGENSYHVVTGSATNATAILDGFTITGGNTPQPHGGNSQGGGILCIAGSPTIRNCSIVANRAAEGYGAGAYFSGGAPALESSLFMGNSTGLSGAGLQADSTNLTLSACRFETNSAASNAGAVIVHGGTQTIMGCSFVGNTAGVLAGGLQLLDGAAATITGTTFQDNHAAGGHGGALACTGSTLGIIDCAFSENTAGTHGGAMHLDGSSPGVTRCTFLGNSAGGQGGGVRTISGNPTFIHCRFLGNHATSVGGGLCNNNALPTLIGCLFSGNTTATAGGAIHNTSSSPLLYGCTISQNGSTGSTGGAHYAANSFGTIKDSIVWGNGAPPGTTDGAQIGVDFAGQGPIVSYTDVQRGYPGTGNIDADPDFIDPGGADNVVGTTDDNLRLAAGSPCIDTGDPAFVPTPGETDLAGQPRVVNGRVDMGAYERFRDCNDNDFEDAAEIAAGTSPDCNANGVPDECDLDGSDGVAPLEHRVFVSSQTHNGNFGGLAGADAMCQQLAQNAGLRRQYKAIMSDADTPANSRIVLNGGAIYSFDAVRSPLSIKSNGNLWDGQLLDHAIHFDEFGALRIGSVWTGSNLDGTTNVMHCNNWTVATPVQGRVGDSSQTDSVWINDIGLGCLNPYRLYCISQGISTEMDCNSNGVPDECELTNNDCNTNSLPDECDPDCNGNGIADACDSGPPAATILSVVSRRNCDVTLLPTRRSESRQGGVTEIRIGFDAAPGCRGADVTLEQATCAAPAFAPYAGASDMVVATVGSELVLTFAPALENGCTYRITPGPEVTSIAGQFVEFRGLVGDVNSDGLTNALDRSVVVGTWTGPGFTCATDTNNDGITNGVDRSIIVGAWTGSQNCAP